MRMGKWGSSRPRRRERHDEDAVAVAIPVAAVYWCYKTGTTIAEAPMPDAPDSLVLVWMRRLDGPLNWIDDRLTEMIRRIGQIDGTVASVSRRVDRIGLRMDRI